MSRVTGMDKVRKNLERAAKAHVDGLQAAAFEEHVENIEDAQARAPKLTGELRESAFVAPPRGSDKSSTTTGGFGADHATSVHERMGVRHPTGEVKFLQRAIDDRSTSSEPRLAKATARNAKRGTKPSAVHTSLPVRPPGGRRT